MTLVDRALYRLRGLPPVSEASTPLPSVVSCWNGIWKRHGLDPWRHRAALSLLLGNPLEIVERACEDDSLSDQLRALLGTHETKAEHWSQLGVTLGVPNKADTPLIDIVKLLKCPSWRFRSEVRGLANIAVHVVTQGRFSNVVEVGAARCRGVGPVGGWAPDIELELA